MIIPIENKLRIFTISYQDCYNYYSTNKAFVFAINLDHAVERFHKEFPNFSVTKVELAKTDVSYVVV